MDDTISRQAAIDALWKALYKYEDETEKQFQTSEVLDVGDWIEHRIFVQNMNDIDRQTILNLPTAQPDLDTRLYTDGFVDGYKQAQMDAQEIIRCKDCKHLYEDNWCPLRTWRTHTEDDFCSYAERRTDE